MPKVIKTCVRCGSEFGVYPARIRDQEKRGVEIKFCSRACTAAARAEGLIGSRKRMGKTFPCSVCGSLAYKKAWRAKRDTLHFCSEACRIHAQRTKLLDRSGANSGGWRLLTGAVTNCVICGANRYTKKSHIARRVGVTCGSRDCASAYGRSLWGLPPFSSEERKKPKGPSRRRTNFTAKQRVEWIGTACVRCGSTHNLCLDHIVPVCAGGESVRENAQTLCQPCNNRKVEVEDRPLARAVNKLQKVA